MSDKFFFITPPGENDAMDEDDQREYMVAVERLRHAVGENMGSTAPQNLLAALITTLAYLTGFLVDQCGAEPTLPEAVKKDFDMAYTALMLGAQSAKEKGKTPNAH